MLIREFTDNDLDDCISLLRSGHDPDFSVERFMWLHRLNPQAPSRIALALDSGCVIGFYGVIKKNLLVDDKQLVGGRDIDPVVHLDYRGKGVFGKLLEYGLENFREVDVFFNFANHLSAPGFLKKGWQHIGYLQDYIFQTNVKKIDLKKNIACVLCWGRLFLTKGTLHSGRIKEVHSSSLGVFDNFLCSFNGSSVHVQRNRDYLEWRYLNKPDGQYRFFVEKFRDASERLFVLKFDDQREEVIICDVFHSRGTGPSFCALFKHLRKLGRGYKVKVWGSFHHNQRGQFIHNPVGGKGGHLFLVRKMPGKDILPDVHNFHKWMITHGDLEII